MDAAVFLEDEDGRHLLGRTYDQFGDLTANRVISVPQRIPCAPGLHGEGAVPGEYSYTGIAVLHRIAVRGLNAFASGMLTALSNGVVSAVLAFSRSFLFTVASIQIMPVLQ